MWCLLIHQQQFRLRPPNLRSPSSNASAKSFDRTCWMAWDVSIYTYLFSLSTLLNRTIHLISCISSNVLQFASNMEYLILLLLLYRSFYLTTNLIMMSKVCKSVSLIIYVSYTALLLTMPYTDFLILRLIQIFKILWNFTLTHKPQLFISMNLWIYFRDWIRFSQGRWECQEEISNQRHSTIVYTIGSLNERVSAFDRKQWTSTTEKGGQWQRQRLFILFTTRFIQIEINI